MEEVRILTLWQPWASFIALGLKQYETRSWGTPYQGKLAIHAAKHPLGGEAMATIRQIEFLSDRKLKPVDYRYPMGAIVAIADLTQCPQMTNLPAANPPWRQISLNTTCSGLTRLEIACGDWSEGRYAWKLENVRPIAEPIKCRGAQGLRRIEDAAVLEAIQVQLAQTDRIEAQLKAIGGVA